MSKTMCDHSNGWRPEDGVPDLAMMSDISDESINLNLKTRYNKNEIYTYSGSVLIAINPYKPLEIYSQEYIDKYRNADFDPQKPHVFALAEAMYMNLVLPSQNQLVQSEHQSSNTKNNKAIQRRMSLANNIIDNSTNSNNNKTNLQTEQISSSSIKQLVQNRRNQACVISGESGAGKTETTKFILSYLCSICSNKSTWIEHQILEASTILESFGNSKTVRNDNSSRFGKFIQISFDSHCQINGCIIQDYLLEQSRLTCQSKNERNYHVFYQLLSAAKTNNELRNKYHLLDIEEYEYLNSTNCFRIEGVDDSSMFDSLRMAMSVLGVSQEDCDSVFSILSAVLLLGNITFSDSTKDANNNLINNNSYNDNCCFTQSDEKILDTISLLLGISISSLKELMLKRHINVRGLVTEIPLSIDEAKDNRNGMAKALYSNLFSWIVQFINISTNPGSDDHCFLGVLDIFGFENFETNSFEQLCINYANEKLHKFFNHHMFAMEQELYEREGLDFCTINYTDNTLCLDLLEKPPNCILRLLSEECRVPKGSDRTFVEKLHLEFADNPFYKKGDDRRKWSNEFSVRHFAGPVIYKVDGMLAKNKDVQQNQLFEILNSSTKGLLRKLSQNQMPKHVSDNQDHQTQKKLGLLRRSSCVDTQVSSFSSKPSLISQQTFCFNNADNKTSSSLQSNRTLKSKSTVADTFRSQLFSLVEILNSADPWYVRCIKTNLEKSASEYDDKQVMLQLKYLGMSDLIKIRREGHPIHLTKHQFVCRYRCLLLQRTCNATKNQSPILLDPLRIDQTCLRMIDELNLNSQHYKIGKTMIFLRANVYQPLEKMRNNLFVQMSIVLQKYWRGYTKKKVFDEKRSAALIIQQKFRAYRGRLLYLRKKRAILTIQAYTRGMFAREIAHALREIKIADKIKMAELKMRNNLSIMKNNANNKQSQNVQNQSDEQQVTISKLECDNENEEEEAEVDIELLIEESIINEVTSANSSRPTSLQTTKDEKELDELMQLLEKHGMSLDLIEKNGDNIYTDLGKLHDVLKNQQISCDSSISASEEQLDMTVNTDADNVSCSGQSQMSSTLTDDNINKNRNSETDFAHLDDKSSCSSTGDDDYDEQDAIRDSNSNQFSDSIQSIASIVSETSNHSIVNKDSYDIDQSNEVTINESSKNNDETQTQTLEQFAVFLPKSSVTSNATTLLERIDEEPNSISETPSKIAQVKTVKSDGKSKSEALFEESRHLDASNQYNQNLVALEEIKRKRLERKIDEVKQKLTIEEKKVEERNHQLVDNTQISASNQLQHQDKLLSDSDEAIYFEKSVNTLKACSILEYAENVFNKHPRNQNAMRFIKTLSRRRKSVDNCGDTMTKIEMLSYTATYSIPTSHIKMHCPINAQISCTIFKNLCRYMSSESLRTDHEVRIIQSIIRYGLEKGELRDEIYVQIIRQMTNNPNQNYRLRLWILIGLVSSAFLPSKQFSKYVFDYIREKPKKDSLIICHSQFVLDNLQTQRTHVRKYPPSYIEILACKKLTKLVCKIILLDGNQEMIGIHPCDTAHDTLSKLANKIDLQSIEGWALYETECLNNCQNRQGKSGISKLEKSIRPSTYIADLFAKQSTLKNYSTNTISKNKHNENMELVLTLKKRLIKGPKIRNDPMEISLLYHQALLNTIKKDSYLVDENLAISLAGLQAQILYGNLANIDAENKTSKRNKKANGQLSFKRLMQLYEPSLFICMRLRRASNNSKKEWASLIMQSHKRNHNLNEVLCKVRYLSMVIYHCPLYGTTIFSVLYKGYQSMDHNLCLGINWEGVVVIRTEDKALISAYRYAEIERRITVYPDDCILQMNIKDKLNDIKCFSFETEECEEIALLIVSYSTTHNINLRSVNDQSSDLRSEFSSANIETNKKVQLKMTLEDRLRIHQDVQNCRRAIVSTGKLRKLAQDIPSNRLTNTLKKLSNRIPKSGDKNSRFDDVYGTIKKQSKEISSTNSDYSIYGMTRKHSPDEECLDDISGATQSSSTDECIKSYPYNFWAYSKYPLENSLLLIFDADLEEAAIINFNSILKYSGLLVSSNTTDITDSPSTSSDTCSTDSGLASASQQSIYQSKKPESLCDIYDSCPRKLDEKELILLAQENLTRCLKDGADILKNEFFLQLIKQTTDHPDSNSEVNIRHWQLLTLACSITYPNDPKILAYLFAHLRRCSLDQITEEGKFARFTMKNLQGTVDTKGRRHTPSETEILSTINCRRVCARVYFLDGQFQTVEFDPCATIAEVINQIKQKIGIRRGEGYALFQPLDEEYEEVLSPDEKVGDAISAWENWHKAKQWKLDEQIKQQQTQIDNQNGRANSIQKSAIEKMRTVTRSRTHRFVFKKYLFISSSIALEEPVERELLYYQTIANIKEDKFPIQENEACILCALKAQIEIGDFNKLTNLTRDQAKMVYKQIIMSLMPPNTFNSIPVLTVEQQHQALRGLNIMDSKKYFFNLIQSFGQTTYNNVPTNLLLHKSHVYKAIQTFASVWPSEIWLAVDQTGLHMLIAKTRKILLSCEFRMFEQTAYDNYLVIISHAPNSTARTKYTFYTKQASQISNQIKDYVEVLNSGIQRKTVKFNVIKCNTETNPPSTKPDCSKQIPEVNKA